MRAAAFLAAVTVVLGGCRDRPTARDMTAEEVADELAGMQIDPGLWELRSEIVDVRAPDLPREIRNRMIGPRSTLRNCITPGQAAHPSANFLAGRTDGACTYREFSVRDGRLRGAMTCPNARARMDGRYTPRGYDLRMEMESPMQNGATMTLEIRARGQRIGECGQGAGGTR